MQNNLIKNRKQGGMGKGTAVGSATHKQKSLRSLRGAQLSRAYLDAAAEARDEYGRLSRDPAFVRGVAMFWMGGTKTLQNQVKFGSTDPYKVRAFLHFLTSFCGVTLEEVRIMLHAYPDIDPESAQRFWAFATNIPISSFYKTGRLPARKKLREASHGLCTLIVHNAYVRAKLGAWIEMLSKQEEN